MGGAGVEGSLICGECRREQPPHRMRRDGAAPVARPVVWHLCCGASRLQDPRPPIPCASGRALWEGNLLSTLKIVAPQAKTAESASAAVALPAPGFPCAIPASPRAPLHRPSQCC